MQAIKSQTGANFKHLLEMNLVKYSSKFLGNVKKNLGQTGTPINVRNNCIKLSCFGVDITRLPLNREITKNISWQEKFFNSENSFGGF